MFDTVGQTTTRTLPTLAGNETVVLSYTAVIADDATGILTNVVTVTPDPINPPEVVIIPPVVDPELCVPSNDPTTGVA